MKNLKKIIAAAALLLLSAALQAQNTESGYFTDGYLFRHEMNPAIANSQNYVSMPILGNFNLNMHGTLGIRDVLYNVNGRTSLFTNPLVPVSQVMDNIGDKNRVGLNFKMQILGAGFKAWGGYNTIGISLRANEESNVPGSFFSLAKEGLANKAYDIRNMRAHTDAFAEISLGHSHQIDDRWRVGGALKVLLGGGNVDAYFDKAELVFNGEDWTALTNATVESSIKGFAYETTIKERGPEGHETLHSYVSGAEVHNPSINGWGLAFDLGAEFRLNDDWKFSAAVLDLGFLKWNNNVVASTNGDRFFSLDKYVFNPDDEADNSFEREADRLAEGLAELYELQDNGDQGGRTTALAATINLGVEYTLPVYRKMTFGLLNTTRIHGAYTWTDFRLSSNWKPTRAFSMGANMAMGTYGFAFGWIINVHPKGFNLFLAMDRTLGKLAKQGVPLSSNAELTMGINFPF